MKNDIELLDSDFDSLSYWEAPTAGALRPVLVPHCDCVEANVAFGRKLDTSGRITEPSMVPVEGAKNGFCPHCGYQTRLQAPVTRVARKAFKPSRGAVRGVCVTTGNILTFKSEAAARTNGFPSVGDAIRAGRPRKGYLWSWVA